MTRKNSSQENPAPLTYITETLPEIQVKISTTKDNRAFLVRGHDLESCAKTLLWLKGVFK